MTLVLIGLAAVVIVAAVLIRSAMASGGTGSSRAEIDQGRSDLWLSEARSVVRDGRQLAGELEAPIEACERDSTVHVSPHLEHRVEALTREIAELTTTAPTQMDVRVCRGLSIKTRTLGDAISVPDVSDARPDRAPIDRRELADLHADFVTALGDLEAQVDLL